MNCIITFSNNRGRYHEAAARLENSLKGRFDGHFVGYRDEASIGAPPHLENPYAFKVYAFRAALKAGYKKILYVDSCVFVVADVQPVFDLIEQDGIVFQEAGHYCGTWTSDRVLSYFGINRDEAMEMPMIGNAGFLGIDFDSRLGQEFFFKWSLSMEDGCFKGEWDNGARTESQDDRCRGSRHDMSCSSIIINKMGLIRLAQKGDEMLEYAAPEDAIKNETIIFKANGF